MKKKFRKFSIKTLAVVMVISTFTMAASGATNVKTSQANLFSFTGEVTVSQGGSKTVKAFSGMRLHSGYSVKTGAGSGAFIIIDSDKALKMDQNTHIKISKISGNKINISLVSGKIFNDIKNKLPQNATYTITTANSVMGVRGTVFSVGANIIGDNSGIERISTIVTVFEGIVAMEDTITKTQIEVSQGYQGMNQSMGAEAINQLPEIAPITAEQIDSFEWKALKEVERSIPMLENKNLAVVIEEAQERERIVQKQKEQETATIIEQMKSETGSNFALDGITVGSPVGMNPGADIKVPSNPPATSGGGGGNGGGSSKPTKYEVSLQQTPGGTITATDLSAAAGTRVSITAEAQDSYEFSSWKIEGATLSNPEANSADFLMGETRVTISAVFQIKGLNGLKGAGSKADPFQIADKSHMLIAMNSVNDGLTVNDINMAKAYYKVVATNAIELKKEDGFVGIGTVQHPFGGYFDGGEQEMVTNECSLFGKIKMAEISNVKVATTINEGQTFVGGLIASSEDSTIKNCKGRGTIQGTGTIGGFIGHSNGDTITECAFEGSVSGTGSKESVGGFVGVSYGSQITSCYTAGSLAGGTFESGGFVGYNNNQASIQDCYANMEVAEGSSVGGFAGKNSGESAMQRCYSLGRVSVETQSSNVGGFVGENSANSSITSCITAQNTFAEVNLGTISKAYHINTEKTQFVAMEGTAVNAPSTIEFADLKESSKYEEIGMTKFDFSAIGEGIWPWVKNIAEQTSNSLPKK